MTERPTLFKGEMVLRVLDDSKTQTRRVPTSTNTLVDGKRVSPKAWKAIGFDWRRAQCVAGPCILVPEKGKLRRLWLSPVWQVGDHLWVREMWRPGEPGRERRYISLIEYRAGGKPLFVPALEGIDPKWDDREKWRASIHMPRWASRIDLEVLSMRAERVQDISEEDFFAEGLKMPPLEDYDMIDVLGWWKADWRKLWDSIYAKRGYGWDTNRPVWVAGFKRIKR